MSNLEPRAKLKLAVDELIRHRRLAIPSDHFAAVVAYLLGLESAEGGLALKGFRQWLGTPSITWWGQIERRTTGTDERGPGDMVDRLSSLDSEKCVEALFTALSSFLSGDTSPALRPDSPTFK